MRLLRGVAFASLLSFAVSSVPRAAPQESVDAATFALAFRAGKADQYKGRTIAGSGLQFGQFYPGVLVTIGAAGDDGRVTPITTRDQLTAANNARATLQILVTGADVQPTPPRGAAAYEPVAYTFTGVYNGHMRTAMRPRTPDDAPDTGVCPDQPAGLTAHTSEPMTEYCVPMIESGTVQK